MSTPAAPRGDLSVTALYTAGCWAWADFDGAQLYRTQDTDRVFGVVNAVMWLASWFSPGGTSLRHDLAHRHAALNHLVERAAPAIVLELAAGLSPRGAAYTAAHDATWIEVDLPGMVAYKTALLEAGAGAEVLARPNLQRVAADVSITPLREVAEPVPPAMVLAEGLIVYLSPRARLDLFRGIASWLSAVGGSFAFDLVPPAPSRAPGWLTRGLTWLMGRFTGGQGFDPVRFTVADIEEELYRAGFDAVEAIEPSRVAADWALPFANVRTHQLVWVATVQASSAP